MNGKRLAIGGDMLAAELQRLTRREPDRAAAARMQAIACALEGMTPAEAARLKLFHVTRTHSLSWRGSSCTRLG